MHIINMIVTRSRVITKLSKSYRSHTEGDKNENCMNMYKENKNAPKIGELKRAETLVDEDVVGLDVGVHETPRGHVLQRCHELLCVLLDGVNIDARLSGNEQ